MITLVASVSQAALAQIGKGYIKMEITDVYSENEQMMAMSGMFTGSTTEIYFTPDKAYTYVNMMNGMNVTQVLIDKKSNENVMLMSVMGQKMKIDMNEEEFKEMQAGAEDAKLNYEHFRDETKEILGFKCHKVKVSGESTQGADMTMWVTGEISTDAHVTNGIQTEMLEGFPLEYVISLGGQLELTMKATDFKKDFDESVFNLKTDGYQEMTLDEFMQSMGAMGGGGF
jgi:hypothetical protein